MKFCCLAVAHIFLWIVFTSSCLFSQVNIKVGYGLAFFSPADNDAILDEFNTLKEEQFNIPLAKSFKGLNTMHGINLGMRYSLDANHAFELGWENLNNSKEALGEDANMALFEQQLYYSSNQYHLAYQFRTGLYGIGFGIGSARTKVKDNIAGSSIKKDIISSSQTVLRFNMAFYFNGNQNVSFSLQPYLHYALNQINLNPLQTELGLTSTQNRGDSFSRVGISFIFYNGPKS